MLTLVGGFATFVLCWDVAKWEYTHHEVERGSTAIALLVLTALYGAAHRRFSLHWLAIPAYLLSSFFIVDTLPAWINGVYKQFAPASSGEAAQAYREGLLTLGFVAAGALAAWLAVARLSFRRAERQRMSAT
jgi:hypothetical protein